MTNSQAATHEIWLVRCSHPALGFSQNNVHDINHGRYPILLPWGLPGFQVPVPAAYIPASAVPVSPTPTDFHTSTTKNDHPTTTVHQQQHYRLHTFTLLLPLSRYPVPASPHNLPFFCSRHTSTKPVKMAPRNQQW